MIPAFLLSKQFLGAAAIVIVAGGLVYKGYDWAATKCENEKIAAVSRANEQAAQIAAQDAEVYDWHIAHNREIETRYKVITNEINVYKPIVGKCFDPLGMSIWNRASEAATDPGLFDDAVPPPK